MQIVQCMKFNFERNVDDKKNKVSLYFTQAVFAFRS